jgi:hypothetical protein
MYLIKVPSNATILNDYSCSMMFEIKAIKAIDDLLKEE